MLKKLTWYFTNLATYLIMAVGVVVCSLITAVHFVFNGITGHKDDADLEDDD